MINKLKKWYNHPSGICSIIWALSLVLLVGIVGPYPFSPVCQLLLFAFTVTAVGIFVGFLASTIARVENEIVSRMAQSLTVLLAGASVTVAITKGKELLVWAEKGLEQPQIILFLVIVLFGILGFLFMYFLRHFVLNPALVRARQDVEKILSAMPNMLAQTPDGVPTDVGQAARRMTSAIVEESFDRYEALLARGIALKSEGNLRVAIEVLDEARSINPDDYRVLAALSSSCLDFGKTEKAFEYIHLAESKRSRKLEPGYQKLYAQVFYIGNEYNKAVDYYLQYLKVHPNDIEARFVLAKAYAKLAASSEDQDIAAEAIAALDTAIRQAPELKQKIIEETNAGGAFSYLMNNKEFYRIVEMEQPSGGSQ